MTSPSPRGTPTAGSLTGVRILLVEDSWHLARAMARLLNALGADLAGPVATAADAERLISERRPDVALVDFSLRDGEPAHDLIDRLQDQGISVIVITGYEVVPIAPGKVEAILHKPVSAAHLIATVRQVTSR
ncbi:Response regulator receiver domain-containing protein [Mesorhizobium ventifaucium]|uniref:Response regulator receiver domain-containing protein n=2 Tax=Mesorhizobium ventifaucium TaxID=666020 RepID=A0ABN8K0G9_9HYPH|nr:Response regulator receiver domain-containing protein [Mesorhizobium ventifaucium]